MWLFYALNWTVGRGVSCTHLLTLFSGCLRQLVTLYIDTVFISSLPFFRSRPAIVLSLQISGTTEIDATQRNCFYDGVENARAW